MCQDLVLIDPFLFSSCPLDFTPNLQQIALLISYSPYTSGKNLAKVQQKYFCVTDLILLHFFFVQ